MKKKYLLKILVVLIFMIVAVTNVKSYATSKTMANSISEDDVQTMIDSSIQNAIAETITNFKAEQEAAAVETVEEEKDSSGIAMIAAALATGLACIGAGIAVAVVASSAVGAISENPSLIGKTIILAGLAEGIAIYGLIISIMILNKF